MWQNVSKIFPLFCGKIFEIFCHGLPAGGGQLFRTSTIFLPLLTPTFRQTRINDSRHCVKFCCLRKSNNSILCTRYLLGLSQTSRVLPTALVFRRQALCCSQLWFFADKHCVVRSHSRMRAVAVGLLSLRYVHLVHQVHQVHLAKCFVTRLAPQL